MELLGPAVQASVRRYRYSRVEGVDPWRAILLFSTAATNSLSMSSRARRSSGSCAPAVDQVGRPPSQPGGVVDALRVVGLISLLKLPDHHRVGLTLHPDVSSTTRIGQCGHVGQTVITVQSSAWAQSAPITYSRSCLGFSNRVLLVLLGPSSPARGAQRRTSAPRPRSRWHGCRSRAHRARTPPATSRAGSRGASARWSPGQPAVDRVGGVLVAPGEDRQVAPPGTARISWSRSRPGTARCEPSWSAAGISTLASSPAASADPGPRRRCQRPSRRSRPAAASAGGGHARSSGRRSAA